MKKTTALFLAFFCLTPSSLAAQINSDFSSSIEQNETKELAPVTISSTTAGDITAAHGIHILIDQQLRILLDERNLTLSGTAVTNGRVSATADVQYAEDYKSVYIPVQEDFLVGESLRIFGMRMRAYDDPFGSRRLGLDLNGDLVLDLEDLNKYEVTNVVANDHTPPYAIKNLSHQFDADGHLQLTWTIPVDYDYYTTIINRTTIKNGNSTLSTAYNGYFGSYLDNTLEGVSSVSYSIVTVDKKGNWSDPVVLELDLTEPIETPENPEIPQNPEESENPQTPSSPGEVTTEELDSLKKLLNYYRLRYQIGCFPGGIAASENDQRCIWPKVDLIYAQEITGTILVPNINLTEANLNLISIVRKYPENRYQTYCVETQTPADYCTSLGKAVKRISYFLD